MRLLGLLTVAVVLGTSFACQGGFQPMFSGWCMAFDDWYFYTSHAIKSCNDKGAHLPVISNAEENQWLLEMNNKYGDSYNPMLGLVCSGGILKWQDGSEVTWTNFEGGEEKEFGCSGSPHYFADRHSGKWEKIGDLDRMDVFCQMPKQQRAPSCDDFEDIGENSCFAIFNSVENWSDAEDDCTQRQGHLASIHTKPVNDFIRRSAVVQGFVNGIHIGLHQQGNQAYNYSWSDGSINDYTNFQAGYPNGQGNCYSMSSDGTWMNEDCASKKPYGCTRTIFDPSHPVAPGQCPEDNLYEAGYTIVSPGYPTAGQLPNDCTYIVGTPGKRAQIQVITFELNQCCDYVDIYDGKESDNHMTRISGQVNANTLYSATGDTMTLVYHSSSGLGVPGFHFKINAV